MAWTNSSTRTTTHPRPGFWERRPSGSSVGRTAAWEGGGLRCPPRTLGHTGTRASAVRRPQGRFSPCSPSRLEPPYANHVLGSTRSLCSTWCPAGGLPCLHRYWTVTTHTHLNGLELLLVRQQHSVCPTTADDACRTKPCLPIGWKSSPPLPAFPEETLDGIKPREAGRRRADCDSDMTVQLGKTTQVSRGKRASLSGAPPAVM